MICCQRSCGESCRHSKHGSGKERGSSGMLSDRCHWWRDHRRTLKIENYSQISNISSIKSWTSNVSFSSCSCLCPIHWRQVLSPLIARFMGPTLGLSGADRTQVGPMNFALWVENEDVVGAVVTGDADYALTTSEWSTSLLPTRVCLISVVLR